MLFSGFSELYISLLSHDNFNGSLLNKSINIYLLNHTPKCIMISTNNIKQKKPVFNMLLKIELCHHWENLHFIILFQTVNW